MSNDNNSPNSSVYVDESDCSTNTNETASTSTTTGEHRLRNKKKYVPDDKAKKGDRAKTTDKAKTTEKAKTTDKAKKPVIADDNFRFKYNFVGHIKVFYSIQTSIKYTVVILNIFKNKLRKTILTICIMFKSTGHLRSTKKK